MAVHAGSSPAHVRQSVESMLAQTLPAGEIVLVCDGPLTAELDRVLAAYARRYRHRFRIVRLASRAGLGPALREGLSSCRYAYVARMDSDDVSCPDRCAKQLAFMQEGGLDLCSGAAAEFRAAPEDSVCRRVLPVTHEALVRFARKRNPMSHPCVMFRKSAVEAAGSYRDMPLFEDYDLWIRMIMSGARLGNLGETLVYMRTGSGLFGRRGGLGYAKAAAAFGKEAYAAGFVGRGGWAGMVASRVVMALLPVGVRAALYRRWLRAG
ncbi:MAG: glycosyltransferase [Treponema sp.]|nr:glycosyltransferase [Treponema sp.]